MDKPTVKLSRCYQGLVSQVPQVFHHELAIEC